MSISEENSHLVPLLIKTYFGPKNQIKPPKLPVNAYWPEIRESIAKFPVTIISGSTGCGKTTQVPQLILEHELVEKEKFCRLVVTQPRRIAAISIAHTVCRARNWPLGSICGYQIGMDRELSRDSCIKYVTTNILVETILHQNSTELFTHIIIDEIHERNRDLDTLLYLLKTLFNKTSQQPKLILMSATAEADLYAKYFTPERCNHIEIKGSVHSVKKLYLEDIPPQISNRILPFFFKNLNPKSPVPSKPPTLALDIDLMKAVADLIDLLDNDDAKLGKTRAAVLIFLPGLQEIRLMTKVLNSRKERCCFEVFVLHSAIPLEEQQKAFKTARANYRKIIVATNIAESSITVPDIKYVIDFCVTKNSVIDSQTCFSSFVTEFASQANCEQRAGRAGRVQDGIVYRLITKEIYNTLKLFPIAEILRCSVDISVLKIKKFGLENPKQALQNFIEAPASKDVSNAILTLKEVQAMQLEHNGVVDLEDGDLTILGRVMCALPLDIRLSKLILMGFAFGCFEECVKIAACLSSDNIIASQADEINDYKVKMRWAQGQFSDPILLLNAFNEYLAEKRKCYDDMRHLSEWTRKQGLQHQRLVEAYHLYEDLKLRLSRMGFADPQAPNMLPRDEALQNLFIQLALCGAFFPFYYCQRPIPYRDVRVNIGYHNPKNTMVIGGLPSNHGPLYAQAIRAALSECLHNEVKMSFRDSDAFLIFENNQNDGVTLDAYLCELYRRKRKSIQVSRISDAVAERLLAKLGISSDNHDGPEISVLPMADCNARKLGKQLMPSDKHFKGQLTWFTNMMTFYVLLDERESELRSLNFEIRDELDRNRAKLVAIKKNPPVGTLILAEFDDSGVFYRARVVNEVAKRFTLRRQKSLKIPVFFIDHGSTAEVSVAYELPESMLLCNSEAPFAYKAQLAHLKSLDGTLQPALQVQKLSQSKACRCEIFSIDGDTLRVTLFVEIDGEEICMNNELVLCKNALYDQEADFSLDNSIINPMRNLIIRGEEFVNINESGLESINLSPPRSPLANCELRVMNKVVSDRRIDITPNSINHVMFGDTGIHQRFVVGHRVSLNAAGNRLQILQSTLMPKLPVMLAFVSLVFAPRAEYRLNHEKTKFVGAICGLGGTVTANGETVSVCERSDLEIQFTQGLDRLDAKIINGLRRLLNEAFCSNSDQSEWTSVPVLRIQKKIEDYCLSFFNNTDREDIEPNYSFKATDNTYKWGLVDPVLYGAQKPDTQQVLFRPHLIPQIRNAATYELLTLLESFMRVSADPRAVQLSFCPLCCTTFKLNSDAIEHCKTNEKHQKSLAKLMGQDYD